VRPIYVVGKLTKIKLNQTKKRTKPSFSSNYTLQKKTDSLPTGPDWKVEVFKVKEDPGEANRESAEELELWYRDPIACIRDLLGNPSFRDHIAYMPQRVFTSSGGSARIYDEMWTGDWWWETQVCGDRLCLVV
jgi:hypothetical protein